MKASSIRQSEPKWLILDAKDQVLGRLATQIASLLRGKGKASFVNHLNCGDHVVVINTDNIVLTGNKLQTKAYYHYSGYPGGMKTKMAKDLITKNSEFILENAVKGMLPKNKLQPEWLKRLHVYSDSNHPHQANLSNN